MKSTKISWICLLASAFIPLVLPESFECDLNEKCYCYRSGNEYLIICVDDDDNFTITFVPEQRLHINCVHRKYNLNVIPDISVGDIDLFNISFCDLSDTNLIPTMNKFNISSIKTLWLFGSPSISLSVSLYHITKQLFEGLSMLEILYFQLWDASFEPDFLDNLSNMEKLFFNRNFLTKIDYNAFQHTLKLRELDLSSNSLSYLPDGVFRNLMNLQLLDLSLNQLTSLNKHTFTGLAHLKSLNLLGNRIAYLDEDFFSELVELETITLKDNVIKGLPQNVFKNLTRLEVLYLSKNQLSSLPNKIFHSLQNLKKLYLDNNILYELNVFPSMERSNLEVLDLSNNIISDINLETYNWSYNHYNLSYEAPIKRFNPLDTCERLQILNLSHNLIDSFPENILHNKHNLTILDLENNKITYVRMIDLVKTSKYKVVVDLSNNNISVVDFQDMKVYADYLNKEKYDALRSNKSSTVVVMSQNPIKCDCSSFDFVQYYNNKLNPVIKNMVNLKMNNLYCASPKALSHLPVKSLRLNQISCQLIDKGCPRGCFCQSSPCVKCAFVDCRKRNFTKPPVIRLVTKNLEHIEVRLEENELETAPYEGLGYENVTRLFLSNNHIRNLSWIPPKIEILALDGNKLRNIDSKIVHALNNSNTLQNMTLFGNPWSCGCSSVSLQNFLINHYKKVNPIDVVCEDSKFLVHKNDLCKSYTAIAMAIALPILVAVCTATLVATLYLCYQDDIKVWLYSKNLCLWFVTEEELDKDKTYDIFISYSHKDEDFVIDNLLSVLETGANPYKICIHVRDWIPGEFIVTQVTRSVLDSRRTLVVLSENFLESVWGKMEFRTAHTQAINEGRARVVVIKYGKIDEEQLDDDLKTYLKTNTYVEWGDPWFWNKLKYALPHRTERVWHETTVRNT